jgi:hypothetical protein
VYKQERLNIKNEECAKLWHEWFELFNENETRYTEETSRRRKVWCKCCDEFSAMIHEEYLEMLEKHGKML